jgi:YHS domain-containing protein
MFVTSIALAVGIGLTVEDKPLVCPMMGSPVSKDSPVVEYAGKSFSFCCGGCDVSFSKDPAGAIKKNEKNTSAYGAFLFDPVSRNRVTAEKSKASVDYMGTRYYFENAENLATFNKDSKKYAMVPKKESLTCAVSGEKVATYSKATSYADYKDVRYYFCCQGCVAPFTKEPDKYAGKAVADPAAIAQKKS